MVISAWKWKKKYIYITKCNLWCARCHMKPATQSLFVIVCYWCSLIYVKPCVDPSYTVCPHKFNILNCIFEWISFVKLNYGVHDVMLKETWPCLFSNMCHLSVWFQNSLSDCADGVYMHSTCGYFVDTVSLWSVCMSVLLCSVNVMFIKWSCRHYLSGPAVTPSKKFSYH